MKIIRSRRRKEGGGGSCIPASAGRPNERTIGEFNENRLSRTNSAGEEREGGSGPLDAKVEKGDKRNNPIAEEILLRFPSADDKEI